MSDALSNAVRDIITERVRQQHVEGYTLAHDDTHRDGALAAAGAAYALAATLNSRWRTFMARAYPWPKHTFKILTPGGTVRSSRRRNAVKAAACMVAEIQRIDREEAMTPGREPAQATGRLWWWFAGEDTGLYRAGPCRTREEAIADALAAGLGRGPGGDAPTYKLHLIEARQDPIDLAGYVDVDMMVEALHERLGSDHGGEDDESPADGAWTTEQADELEKSVRAAVAAWQARNGIVVRPRRFTDTRYAVTVTGDAPAGEASP